MLPARLAMRATLSIVILLTACSPEPRATCGELTQPVLVEKIDLDGTFSHVARVIAADDLSLVGEQRASEVTFVIGEDVLLARAADGRIALALPILAHVDVAVGTDPHTGEACWIVRDAGARDPAERSHVRIDPTSSLLIDPALVPVPEGHEPIALVDEADHDRGLTWYPRRTTAGVLWTFVTSYAGAGGIVRVEHELRRIAP